MRNRRVSSSRFSLVCGLLNLGAVVAWSGASAQGCMPAPGHHGSYGLVFQAWEQDLEAELALGSGEAEVASDPTGGSGDTFTVPRTARDLQLLGPSTWNLTLSLRYFKSGDSFVGTRQVAKGVVVGDYPTLDILGTYAFNRRWSLTVALPITDSRDNFPHPDGQRHTIGAGMSIGDLRVVGSYWLFDSAKPRRGNVAVGLGLKVPTGDYSASADWHTPEGVTTEPLDLAVQPGDGGWGVILAAQAFRTMPHRTFFYADGYYLLNPRETNGTVTPAARFVTGRPIPVSVTDQYLARVGIGYLAWPKQGISLSLGIRAEGIPREDLIGGSDGFRRPGYNLAVDPGINISRGPHTFSLNVPFAVERSMQQSMPELELSRLTGTTIHGGGSLAGESYFIGYSRRLGRPAGTPDA